MGFERPDASAATADKEWTGIRLSSGEAPIRVKLGGLAELDTGESKHATRRPAAEPLFLAGLDVLRNDLLQAPHHAMDLGARLVAAVGREVELDLQSTSQSRPEVPPTPPNVADYRQILWPNEATETPAPAEAAPVVQPIPEVTPIAQPQESVVRVEAAARPHLRSVNELSRSEVLRIAKDITFDGVRLKDIYSARRIDQEGLRAVVETYLRGGDVRRQLSEEIIAKEQSFERDPLLRHQRSGDRLREKLAYAGSSLAGATSGARGALSQRGGSFAKKAGRMIANGARQAQHELIDNGDTANWISITAIVVVYALILLLLLK